MLPISMTIIPALLAMMAGSAVSSAMAVEVSKRVDWGELYGTIQLRPDPAQGQGIKFLRAGDTGEPQDNLFYRTDKDGSLPPETELDFTVFFTPKDGVRKASPCKIVGKMEYPTFGAMAFAFANDDSFLHPCGPFHGVAVVCNVIQSNCHQIGVYDFSIIGSSLGAEPIPGT